MLCPPSVADGLIGGSTGRDKIHIDLYFLTTRDSLRSLQTWTNSSELLPSPFPLRKFFNQDLGL